MTTPTRFYNDLRIISQLARPRYLTGSHKQRLESFYGKQAHGYDDFRERLLPGRRELVEQLIPHGFQGLWIDIGGGTGRTVQYVSERIAPDAQVVILDLCDSLLSLADKRIQQAGWRFARTRREDITTCTDFFGEADVVTFSYSLSMIPNWGTALHKAQIMLKPGGMLGVVDFTCRSDTHSCTERLSDRFWKTWFSYDGVYISEQHHQDLSSRFKVEALDFNKAKIPYLLGAKAPYYTFRGRRIS
jgi:S-adenosylmethionine-diacylgycerolhomoserine-N-methlytransferase